MFVMRWVAKPGALFGTAGRKEAFVRCCTAVMERLQMKWFPHCPFESGLCVQVKRHGWHGKCRYGGKKRNVYFHAAISSHVVMVIMQFLERTWPRSKHLLEDMRNYDLRMVKSKRRGLFALPAEAIEKVRRVGLSRVVWATLIAPVCAFAATMCSISICGSRLNVVGWYS